MENATEAFNEANAAFETNQSELESAEAKLAEIKAQIANGDTSDALALESAEIARQIELLKVENAELLKNKELKSEKAWKDFQKTSGDNSYYEPSATEASIKHGDAIAMSGYEYAQKYLEILPELNDEYSRLAEKINNGTATEAEGKRFDTLKDNIAKVRSDLVEIARVASDTGSKEAKSFVDDILAIVDAVNQLGIDGTTPNVVDTVSTSFGNLKAVLSGAKESIDSSASSLEQLKSAIGVATDWRSTTQEVSNALRTIQQLTGVKLDIKADGLQDTLQLIKAYIDGDIESFNEMASAAMKSLGVKVDPSNIKAAITQLITMLSTLTGEAKSTATALISIFSSVGAVKKVIDKDKLNADIKSGAYKGGSSQGILDKYYKYVVDDNFFNQVSDTATSSTSSGSSTDPRVEAYEAAIARLDHLRAMDIISEQEYYDGMLKAFNDHLKNKTKYQDQWWKYEEAYYAWRKKQVEESAEAEKKAAKANYDAQKDTLDKTKKGYQDELNALKDKINAEKKLLDREADERSHQETVEEINDEIADYNAQIESLMLDDSAKAKAKRLDLEEQKQEAMKKLQDEQADWSKQTQENALDDQMDYWENYYGNLIDLVEESLNRISDAYDRLVSSIESSLESTLSSLDSQMSQTGTGGFDYAYAKGGSKAAIQETQNALMSSDYSVGSTGADGVWGARTERAFIMAWQVYLNSLGANLKVDGVRGSQTKAWEKTLGKVFGQRYHTGGVVGKDITADYRAITSLKPDEVPIVAQKGEVVLTADKVAQLANLVKQNKIVANAFKAFLPTARQPAMAGEAPQLSYSAVFHVNGDVDDATVRKLDKVARTAAQEVYSNAIKGLQKTGRL